MSKKSKKSKAPKTGRGRLDFDAICAGFLLHRHALRYRHQNNGATMIGNQYQDIVSLGNAVISGVSHEGLTVQLINGKPARSPSSTHPEESTKQDHTFAAAWQTSIASYRQFLIGMAHLRVYRAEDSIRMQLGRLPYR
ncbi:hypothetical protein [Cupriavidus plantarum]|uniref:hypothetical protein n=1 Tax=Cupriavidus plantarum TaxID=942865 RepID=UPI000F18C1AB|nr:hypothetical protein [Cupriavidus plantarum]RLK44975.1 hypothetical protein C7417_0978 [Cupriavidus plantarum]